MTNCAKKTLCSLTAILLATLILPGFGAATPYKATLFPASAKIYERGTLKLSPAGQSRSGTIILPGRADPATLIVTPPLGVPLLDMMQEKISSIDSQKLADLKHELANIENRAAILRARKNGLLAKIKFWESRSQTQDSSLEKLKLLAATMGSEIQKDMIAADQTSNEINKAKEAMAKLKNRIAAIQGDKKTSWQINLNFAPGTEQTINCTWSYEVRGCGWTPHYRLEAMPGQNQIHFTWKATIQQSTGKDWNNVSLSLATGRTNMRPTPPAIRPWVLQSVRAHDTARVMLEDAMPKRTARQRTLSVAQNAPVKHEKATYALWELGTRNVPAGEPLQIRIKDQKWPAHFAYTLRPSVSGVAFLHTSVELSESMDLPSGQAVFLADGAFLSKRPFAFSGQKMELFFGADPMITAKVVLNEKKSGNSGVFSKKRTWMWDWDLILSNNKSIPVSVVIEEPRPISRDKDIALTLVTQPEFTSDENPEIIKWPLTLKPQTQATINLHVDAQAPDGMNVDPGWRW